MWTLKKMWESSQKIFWRQTWGCRPKVCRRKILRESSHGALPFEMFYLPPPLAFPLVIPQKMDIRKVAGERQQHWGPTGPIFNDMCTKLDNLCTILNNMCTILDYPCTILNKMCVILDYLWKYCVSLHNIRLSVHNTEWDVQNTRLSTHKTEWHVRNTRLYVHNVRKARLYVPNTEWYVPNTRLSVHNTE